MDAPSEPLARTRRFASLQALARRAWQTFQRFPLSLLSAVAAAIAAHYLVHIDFALDRGVGAVYPIWMACILGIPLFYTLTVLGESRGWSRRLQFGLAVAGLLALWLYYWTMPAPPKGAELTRFLLLVAALLLAAAFAPFIGRPGAENGFWQYNRMMLERLVVAAFFSLALYLGLVLAIAACQNLLEIDINNEIYGQLVFWVGFVYATWFFLAGIPDDVSALQEERDYPTGLRIFTQYVLIPLVAVYLVILYAYMAKIIIQWNLPKGWVGYPVIGLSMVGMLALLLVYPVRDRAEYRWMRTYSKSFYLTLYPLIVLISVAIWTRISTYGITEKRHLVVAATAWLLGIALYFTLKRKADIRVIPVSLCLVTLLSAFGPWSATAVSRRSQLGRLHRLLVASGVMVDGRLTGSTKTIDFDREKEISDIVLYIDDMHGLGWLRDWYADPNALPDGATFRIAMAGMGLEYVSRWASRPEGFSIGGRVPSLVELRNYDYLYRFSGSAGTDSVLRFRQPLGADAVLSLDGTIVTLGRPDRPGERLTIRLTPALLRLRELADRRAPPPLEATTLEARTGRYHLTVYIDSVSGRAAGDTIVPTHLSALFLIGLP